MEVQTEVQDEPQTEVQVEFNLQYPFIVNYNRISHTQQGMTMLVIAMMDPLHKNIQARVKYPSPDDAIQAIEYANSILLRCVHIQSIVRHRKTLDQMASCSRPASIEEYKKDNQVCVVIDIFSDLCACEMHFYLWGETDRRKLCVSF